MYQCVLRCFHSTCLKYCACHLKSDAMSFEVLHLSRKIIFPKLKILCSKMQRLSGNQRPDLLTALMNMSLVLHLPREMHLPDPLQMSHACHRFWKCCKPLTFRSLLAEPSKVVRACGALYILTLKCASRHNGVHLFISHLTTWLWTRRLSEPTFRPCGATNHWKNTVLCDFPTFSRTWIFFLMRLSLF